MVRTKAPAIHFETSSSYSTVADGTPVRQIIYPDSPHRSSSTQKYTPTGLCLWLIVLNDNGPGKNRFVHAASKKALFKRNTSGFKRYRPGEKALREIRHFQKTTDLLIGTSPFVRLVREVTYEMTKGETSFRFQSEALLALQEGTEAFLVSMFEQANYICLHANRVTLQPRDIHLWRQIKEF
uniref:Histone domain-containing protein n=1 Tax=Syphacia muris TaxID=451379 RepID=A0A0N5AQQ3_9BILA